MRGVTYWLLPLIVYFSSVFIIGFSRESLAAQIFISILALHPVFSIPLGYLFQAIQDGLHKCLQLCHCDNRLFKCFCTFTMINYLGCVTACQYYLFYFWIEQRKVLIENGYSSVTTFNEFKDKSFNFCCKDCPAGDETNFLPNLMASFHRDLKCCILISCSLFFFAFQLFESMVLCICHSKPIAMITFILGHQNSTVSKLKENNFQMSSLNPRPNNFNHQDSLEIPPSENYYSNVDYVPNSIRLNPCGNLNSSSLSLHDGWKCKHYFFIFLALLYLGCIICFPLFFSNLMFEGTSHEALGMFRIYVT